MLEAISAIMITTGALIANEISVAVTRSAPGNTDSAKNTPQARVAPTGAENTALNTIASNADAWRTRPVLLRTNCPCASGVSAVLKPAPRALASGRGQAAPSNPGRNGKEHHHQRLGI